MLCLALPDRCKVLKLDICNNRLLGMEQGQKFSNIFRISFMSNLETIIEALEKLVVIDGKCSRINRKLVNSVAVYLFLELICYWFEKSKNVL